MLPYEKIRTQATPSGGVASTSLRPLSPGVSAAAADAGPSLMAAPSPSSVRPHSRPTTQQQLGGASAAHLPRARAVMLPASPKPPAAARQRSPQRAGGSPTRGLASPSGRPPKSGAGNASSVVALSPSAINVSVSTTTASSTSGVLARDLATQFAVTLNLKAFSLDRQLPMTDPSRPAAPKFEVSARGGVCDVVQLPATSPNTGRSSPVALPVDVTSVPLFCRFVVDVDEVGCDRCLQYHVFVESPEMFAVQPEISQDGTLTYAVARTFTGSGTNAWIRLADNAAVTPDGEIATSEPVPVFFNVPGRGGAEKVKVPTAKDWHSFRNKATATSVHVEPNASLPTAASGRPTSPNASWQLATSTATLGGGGAVNTSGTSPRELTSPKAPAPVATYVFPLTNIHTLREDGLDEEPLIRGAPQAAVSAASSSSAVVLHGLLKPPLFSTLLTDVELIRHVHSTLERDRLVGEAADPTLVPALETKLRERLAAEESNVASPSAKSGHSAALLPVVTRLAQLCLMQGSKRIGDAVELFERVVRLRLEDLGVQNVEQVHTTLARSPRTQEFIARVDACVQALTVLATVLKHAARYTEGLEFAAAAAQIARTILGKDHASHIRALAQVAELNFLSGAYEKALIAYRESLELCDIIIGKHSSSASSVRHLIGACLSSLQRPSEAAEAHELALKSRETVYRTAEAQLERGADGDVTAASLAQMAFQVAESLVFCARCAYLANDLDAAAENLRQAEAIFRKFDVSSNAEYAVAYSAVATIAGSVRFANHDPLGALQVLHDAVSAVSTTRGEDSVEFAIASAHLTILQLKYHGLPAPRTELPFALAADATLKSIRARLQRAVSILTSALGTQHPYTARASCVLAQFDATEARNSKGRLAAYAAAERGLKSLERALVAGHRDIGAAMEVAAIALITAQDNRAACDHLIGAIRVAKACKLEARLQRLISRLMLVHGRLREPVPEEIIVIAEEMYDRIRHALGEGSITCLEPLQNLAEAAYAAGHQERAHHFLTKALKIADANNMIFLLGPLFKPAAQLSTTDLNERNRLAANRLDTSRATSFAAVLFSIACVFEAQHRSHEAQSTLLQVLAALELSQQHNSIRTAETLRALGTILYRDGFYGDAMAYCEKALALLLEFHPTAKEPIALAEAAIDVIDKQLQSSGYVLSRHSESRYRFAVFL
jgi:tetratricopeptide (TPR) repeat protein